MKHPFPTTPQQNSMLPTLADKKILLGISGGIAAYKAAELVRQIRKAGADVQVVITTHGSRFITPLTLQTLSERPVFSDPFDEQFEAAIGHIQLARWADRIVIYPASANCIAKLAHGMADNLLTTLVLASEAPTIIAPAMNTKMWLNRHTQDNVDKLRQYGRVVIDPAIGEQACHENGPGRLVEPTTMMEQLHQQFAPPLLKNKTVIITAGPTQEALDPIRYLSNRSSGKMGYALAQAAAAAGAKTLLISGPTRLDCPQAVKRIDVVSADEMYEAVTSLLPCDLFISTAAVANYRPANYRSSKIKSTQPLYSLELAMNRDILQAVAKRPNAPFSIGFAAETHDCLDHAQEKLQRKGVDMIIANHITNTWPMGSEENEVTVLTPTEAPIPLPKAKKTVLAHQLIALIAKKYYSTQAVDE